MKNILSKKQGISAVMLVLTIVIIIAVVIVYVVGSSKSRQNDDLNSNPLQGKIIYNFGDSIAAGDGNNGKGYAELLAEKYGMNVTDYAKGGATLGSNTTNNITTQVDNAIVTGGSPDYILIDGGTNDIVNSTALGTITSDYTLATIDKTTTSGGLE